MAELPKTRSDSEIKPWTAIWKYLSNIQFLCQFSFCLVAMSFLLFIFPGPVDSFFDNTVYITNQHSTGSNIICLGDSLTLGKGSTPGHDYPSFLSRALGINVINAGVDGNETGEALARLDKDVLSKDPKMVIILLGGNDYFDEVPLEEAFKNLDEIVKRVQAKGAIAVLVEIGPSYIPSLQKRYDQIVLTNQSAYVPKIYDGILFNSNLRSDFRHPNDEGYKIIAHRILKVIKPLLEEK